MSAKLNLTDTDFNIAEHFQVEDETEITPYLARTLVNKALAELEIDKELPGPMFYTYVKKGYIGGIKDAKRTTRKAVAVWFEGYLVKHFS